MPNFYNCNNPNPINRFLWFFNPKVPLTCNHYTCGANLAIFSSLAQIESCLTGVTNNCKSITTISRKISRKSNNTDNPNNIHPSESK